MRVNWLSPAAADAARYAAAVLPHLRGRAEVTVWTTRDEPPPWAELNRADVTIFQLSGDHSFREPFVGLSRRHPGIVVLHGDWDARDVPDAALGAVVHRRETFEALRQVNRCPVTYLPPDDPARCADALWEMAADARRLHAAVIAHTLALQAAAALSLWTGSAADAVGLRDVAREIHNLTAPPRHEPAERLPLAA
jgi:hypothetical protein